MLVHFSATQRRKPGDPYLSRSTGPGHLARRGLDLSQGSLPHWRLRGQMQEFTDLSGPEQMEYDTN
jgi:hypothetical protein